jgi:sec-independent protein translocase protein TatC
MDTAPDKDPTVLKEEGLLSHLLELRQRLLRMVVAIVIVFVLLTPFMQTLFNWLTLPLLAQLPADSSMIATQVASPFLTPFKFTFVAAIFLTAPYWLYQLWGFVAPGLYQSEKRFATPLIASSVVLFYLGALFAYFVVFPIVFGFFTRVAPKGVAVMTDITHYYDFVLALFFAFGVAFEIPIATMLLVKTGMVSIEKLKQYRPYVFLSCFVVGMMITPPDIISQTLLAVPMYILYEAGLFFSKRFVPSPDKSKEMQKN